MMTASAGDLGLFAGAFTIAIASPGPFAAAIVARGMALGFSSAAGMALGGLVGDLLFASAALFGIGLLTQMHADLFRVLRLAGAAWLIVLGVRLMMSPAATPEARTALPASGPGPGFVAGAALSVGNPKAALFYAAIFPGFFDIPRLTGWDMAAIYATIAIILVTGHLLWAGAAAHAGRLFATPQAVRRVQQLCGALLAGAGAIVAAT